MKDNRRGLIYTIHNMSPGIVCMAVCYLPSALMAIVSSLSTQPSRTVASTSSDLTAPLVMRLASRPTVWGVRSRLAPSRPARS